jgi:septal ring factor EnvC (AmiA/AmiB activator)
MKNNTDKPITLEVLADFWTEVALPSIDKRFIEEREITNKQFDKVSQKFKHIDDELIVIKGDIKQIKREITEVKGELSNTPTRSEFESFKTEIVRKTLL